MEFLPFMKNSSEDCNMDATAAEPPLVPVDVSATTVREEESTMVENSPIFRPSPGDSNRDTRRNTYTNTPRRDPVPTGSFPSLYRDRTGDFSHTLGQPPVTGPFQGPWWGTRGFQDFSFPPHRYFSDRFESPHDAYRYQAPLQPEPPRSRFIAIFE